MKTLTYPILFLIFLSNCVYAQENDDDRDTVFQYCYAEQVADTTQNTSEIEALNLIKIHLNQKCQLLK